ncbi:amidohydrolase [Marinoscillum furvescens]|uniref:Omega-amidase YafV n=1 Tax=Marinoscillum furvescens DSM 4134 TaxID=1122208 RepID=A0A3D9L4H2_MARFU|nr:amidohydrolase [Marinoscillum furvescens]RED99568.1 putative amidohydrolase [Marinoscillum furvescens DSM 4134]
MKLELSIALLQADLFWENPDANRASFEEMIWQVPKGTDLIILPEMFTTGFSMQVEQHAEVANTNTLKWMQQQAAQTGAVLMGSVMTKAQGNFYNRMYVVYPDGSFKTYDKRHLFGLAGEDKDYTAGTERVVVEVQGWKVFPLICYDLRFPVWARSQHTDAQLYEYDLLVYVANWPAPRVNAWDTLLAARAIENISYCVGVNRVGEDGVGASYVGHSAVYDYKGAQLTFSDKAEIMTAKLYAEELKTFRERFPFQADADQFRLLD